MRRIIRRPLSIAEGIEPVIADGIEPPSTWDITGLATAGPLAAQRLAVAIHTVEFWFAFAAFHPAVPIWQG